MKEALRLLKTHSANLTKQQYKTLRGQVLAGDFEGAMRGLAKILHKGQSDMIATNKN